MDSDTTEFSTRAVSHAERVPTLRVAAVASMVSLSLPTFITGIEVAEGVGVDAAIPVIALGALIIFLVGAAMGFIGAKTGFSSYLLVRIAFGDAGAKLVNTAFALSLIGWFGVNVNLLGQAVNGLSRQLLGLSPPELSVTVVASALITVTTIFGFKAINWLATLLVPVLILIVGRLLWVVLGTEGDAQPVVEASQSVSWGTGVSAIVGSIIVGAIIMPDITRFLRAPSRALVVTGVSYLLVQPAVMVIAVLAGLALAASDMIDMMVLVGLGSGAFVIVIASSWILNALNLYSAVLGLTASFPKLPATRSILCLGITGAIAGAANILDSFLTFLFYLSVVFIPVAGVIIVDCLHARSSAYRQTSVSDGQPTNLEGLIAWLAGAAIALAAAEGLLPSVTQIATLDAVLISASIYWLGRRRRQRKEVDHAHRY